MPARLARVKARPFGCATRSLDPHEPRRRCPRRPSRPGLLGVVDAAALTDNNPEPLEVIVSSNTIEQLAVSFPSLANQPGVTPWDSLALDAWACGPAPSHGMLCAARFVLAVWDPNTDWRCGRFDLMEAMGVWDVAHHRAFVAWALAPWWP